MASEAIKPTKQELESLISQIMNDNFTAKVTARDKLLAFEFVTQEDLLGLMGDISTPDSQFIIRDLARMKSFRDVRRKPIKSSADAGDYTENEIQTALAICQDVRKAGSAFRDLSYTTIGRDGVRSYTNILRSLIARLPRDLELEDELGCALAWLGEHYSSVAIYLQAEKEIPKRFDLYAGAVCSYCELNLFEQARVMLDKAAEISGNRTNVSKLSALILMKEGRYDDACVEWLKCKMQDLNLDEAIYHHTVLGKLKILCGHARESETAFSEADVLIERSGFVEEKKAVLRALISISRIEALIPLARYGEAEVLLGQSDEIAKRHSRFKLLWAKILLEKGAYQEALTYMMKNFDEMGSETRCLEIFARCYIGLGRFDDAKINTLRLFVLEPQSTRVRELLEHISKVK